MCVMWGALCMCIACGALSGIMWCVCCVVVCVLCVCIVWYVPCLSLQAMSGAVWCICRVCMQAACGACGVWCLWCVVPVVCNVFCVCFLLPSVVLCHVHGVSGECVPAESPLRVEPGPGGKGHTSLAADVLLGSPHLGPSALSPVARAHEGSCMHPAPLSWSASSPCCLKPLWLPLGHHSQVDGVQGEEAWDTGPCCPSKPGRVIVLIESFLTFVTLEQAGQSAVWKRKLIPQPN